MAAQPNIINDVGTLTKIPNKILDDIVAKLELCIGSAIHDALEAKEETTVLNIGIGSLSVNLVDMQCKFIPNKALKTVIKRCITEDIDPVEFTIEQTVINKLITIYQEEI